uniref:TBC1 domain family member 10B n=1 Tax=Pelusios castaneus TaxID=367368 RepID=A0A8C8RLQ2_9SAUR
MEMGAGDAPSPPPRYNAPRSALYAAKMGAMVTPTGLSPSSPATATLASTRPLGSVAVSPVATGNVAASPVKVRNVVALTGSVAATGSVAVSPVAMGNMPVSPVKTSNVVAFTGSVATSPAVPGSVAATTGSVAESPAATGSVAATMGSVAASPAAMGSMVAATGSVAGVTAVTSSVTETATSPVASAPVANMVTTMVNVGTVSTAITPMAGVSAVAIPTEMVTTVATEASSTADPLASPTMAKNTAAEMAGPPILVKSLPAPFPSPTVVVVAPSPVVQEKSSPTAMEGPAAMDPAAPEDMGSLSSLGPGIPPPRPPPAPDTLSYLDSVSLMSGTLESLTGAGFLDDVSSLGSDSEINGLAYRRTDKYGFLGGNQYTGMPESAIPVDVARQRELKWLDMFYHWDKWLSRRFQKVKLRCRKGIPSSLRARAWQLLSNSKELLDQNPNKFEELERQAGDPKWLDVIEKDLHRQFPFHEMFAARGGHGQQDLYRILKAYTIYRPDEGYCQAQAPVAAVLLMHMPAEQAFWCLVQICEKYLPGYYSAGLEAIQLDGEIFFALLRRASPIAYRHLRKYKIDPILYMTEWFMCVFSRTLPWSSVLRVWDMFFCEGVKIIFRVGLVLLRNTLGSVDKLHSCQGMYETMEKLRNLPAHYMQEEFLVNEVVNLPVTEALIERENATQLKKWRETRGELQYKPSRRLHGSRAIYEERHRMNPPLSSSASLLSLTGFKQRAPRGSSAAGARVNFSPAHSAVPPPAANQGQVVSEGLHPALPSPTGNNTPLGGPKKGGAKEKKKEKERQKQEKEQEKKLQKEREKQEKEKEKLERKQQKERAKEEAKQKKERKVSMRRKEAKAPPPAEDGGQDGDPPGGSVLQDTYF